MLREGTKCYLMQLIFLRMKIEKLYVRILIAMAGADGTLVREETAAIEAAMGRALIPPGKRDLLRQELKTKLDIEEVVVGMSDVAIRLALRDATIVGACDGEFQEEEIQFLLELAKYCDLEEKDLNKFSNGSIEGGHGYRTQENG